jgi:hypothetical protein
VGVELSLQVVKFAGRHTTIKSLGLVVDRPWSVLALYLRIPVHNTVTAHACGLSPILFD